jgi:HlyD family secretion protein
MSKTLSVRKHFVIGVLTICVLLIGFGTWGARSKISGAIIANGQIEVDKSRQVVQHPDGGVVQSILVREGDVVVAGQPLILLDPTEALSQLSITRSQLYEAMARRARLQAERDGAEAVTFDTELRAVASQNPVVEDVLSGQTRLFEARAKTLNQEIEQLGKKRAQIGNQIDGIRAQQDALTTQIDLIEQELITQRSLQDRGLATAARVLALLREEARLRGTVGGLTASEAEFAGQITSIDLSILKLGTDRREAIISDLRDVQLRELELSANQATLVGRLDRLEMRAPVGGIVLAMQVFAERSVIKPADPVLFIVPQDRTLVISAKIDPTDVDQVYVGQEAILRFSALGSRDTPELTGTMIQLSPDALVDSKTGLAHYISAVELNEGEQDKLPEGVRLLPGMPVETYFSIGDRSPLAFLIKPFADYFNRAFREE